MSKTENFKDLYDLIDELDIAMMVTEVRDDLRSKPMKTHIDTETGHLWFLTKASSGKAIEILNEHAVNLAYACPKSSTYVSVTGTVRVGHDKKKIDWMWPDESALWFQYEQNDPSVAAICVMPNIAEYWDSTDSKILKSWEIVKSKLMGETPDLGDIETVRLS
jgi:general stress protein 26